MRRREKKGDFWLERTEEGEFGWREVLRKKRVKNRGVFRREKEGKSMG